MNTVVENLTGTNVLTDQVIATDCLIATKTGIKNYAVAITETATPEIKTMLRKQLDEAINMHDKISKYMIDKGWYHAYNIQEQLQLDIKNAETALNLA